MDTKVCKDCGIAKTRADFNWCRTSADDLRSNCKHCQAKITRAKRLAKLPEDRESKRRYQEANRERRRAYQAAWRLANRERYLAHKAVYRALRAGKLVRPESCELCGNSGEEFRIEAHHSDYENRLDVEWLCAPCHHLRHSPLESAAQDAA